MSAPDLADCQAADDLHETALQALESATAVRRDAHAAIEAAQERYDYWCGVEAQAIAALLRAEHEQASTRKAAGLVLTASGYRSAS